uniref:Uncharacterized protein n=1 Tax=Rhizophora mucronata TaxID=61149 RepID=A0A2P2QTK0_RHIMU
MHFLSAFWLVAKRIVILFLHFWGKKFQGHVSKFRGFQEQLGNVIET